uniref:Uncharacterized protein n=1 Tax=Mycena chlorophos TaxID=658473 RepID=A0ABQ0MCT0_MYCCL|nr:predicted protein [Mycena chlorophos]
MRHATPSRLSVPVQSRHCRYSSTTSSRRRHAQCQRRGLTSATALVHLKPHSTCVPTPTMLIAVASLFDNEPLVVVDTAPETTAMDSTTHAFGENTPATEKLLIPVVDSSHAPSGSASAPQIIPVIVAIHRLEASLNEERPASAAIPHHAFARPTSTSPYQPRPKHTQLRSAYTFYGKPQRRVSPTSLVPIQPRMHRIPSSTSRRGKRSA